ncbi:uncharacterized protein K444DRAFT_662185 [Hyaloscypha bicolor E]|uniref:Uncharacterized protein n=1 Tax=Hyaloscypha bicolor E TaxID=1095630 RepID=A0A2J6TGC3_9HELO|nr:uncharacterized protein K444DRAFT_662185 [Hyaloscypha bicolor E]PMD62061.1 hypothetical protein K444DRAFT_662185 [Hyaloscypha bicolor E]
MYPQLQCPTMFPESYKERLWKILFGIRGLGSSPSRHLSTFGTNVGPPTGAPSFGRVHCGVYSPTIGVGGASSFTNLENISSTQAAGLGHGLAIYSSKLIFVPVIAGDVASSCCPTVNLSALWSGRGSGRTTNNSLATSTTSYEIAREIFIPSVSNSADVGTSAGTCDAKKHGVVQPLPKPNPDTTTTTPPRPLAPATPPTSPSNKRQNTN